MDYIQIGKIINTHGIKGELKIYPLTDDMYRFNHLKSAFIGEEKIEVNVENVKYHKGFPILKFKEFHDIDQVLKYKEAFLYVDMDGKVDLPEDHYFIFDIINCEVYDADNNLIGTVIDVMQSAGNDIYIVKDINNQKEYMIPAIKEFFVLIDIDNKKIVIDPIEGMIE